MTTAPWQPLLDARTPFSALGTIIERCVASAIEEFREQLRVDWAFSPAAIDVAVSLARPHVEAQISATIFAGWQACQLDGRQAH
jgi:hypothetical protein